MSVCWRMRAGEYGQPAPGHSQLQAPRTTPLRNDGGVLRACSASNSRDRRRSHRDGGYAAFASATGGLGIKVDRPDGVRAVIQRALAHDGPALVDVNVNPDEPPLPGKVEYQQALKFAEAFMRGQPRKATIATTLFRDKVEQLKS